MALKTIDEQASEMNDNLNNIASFIDTISQMINGYYQTITELTEKIDALELAITALTDQVQSGTTESSTLMIKLDKSSLNVSTNSTNYTYMASVGVFTNKTTDNIYVSSSRTINGMYLVHGNAEIPVTKPTSDTSFYTFNAAASGTMLKIKTKNVGNESPVILTFGNGNNTSVNLQISFKYNAVKVTKPAVKPTYNNTQGKYASAIKVPTSGGSSYPESVGNYSYNGTVGTYNH